jgi:hypothetical protein
MNSVASYESSIFFIRRNVLTPMHLQFSPGSHSARQALDCISQHTTLPLVVEKVQKVDVIRENKSRTSPRGRVAALKVLNIEDEGQAVLFTASMSCDVVDSPRVPISSRGKGRFLPR